MAKRRTTLTVLGSESLNPNMVRVRLGGPGYDEFVPSEFTDSYVKLAFVHGGHETMRTYTVRSVDPVAREIAIDFVVHGDEGIAGPWAASVQPGVTIDLLGPGGAYAPRKDADWHLFAGDESAVPAVTAALAALPLDAVGVALLEVHGPDHEIAVDAPEGVEIRWLHRDGAEAGTTSLLADALAELPWRGGRAQVFAHGTRQRRFGIAVAVQPHQFDAVGTTQVQLPAWSVDLDERLSDRVVR